MPRIVAPLDLPDDSLLAAYRREGAYVDCYATVVTGTVALEEYVAAFYTTWLFALERGILRLVSKASTDAEAQQLARGAIDRFAAWSVEGRTRDELLLRDYTGRTRSWLMVRPLDESPATRLYFGSAVVPRAGPDGKDAGLGFPFDLLLDFHRAYSVALLQAARARLVRSRAEARAP